MDKFEVNIYIETSTHGPAVRNGSFGYVVEYYTKNGQLVTREGFGKEENSTENRLALLAINEAIKILQKPCSLRVNTECGHILNAYSGWWPRQWQENGWRNAKGKPVKNADQWEMLMNLLEPHVITFTNAENEYRPWIKKELEKRMK